MNPALRLSVCIAAAVPVAAAASATTCAARSGPAAVTLVELYTSEGCSSCPPADRWLSTLKGRADVIALAFHVNYWDALGWRDRFATPAFTQRQRDLARANGSRVVYTPQVLVNGRDWRGWPSLPAVAQTIAPTLTLQRDGDAVVADIGRARDRLSGYWALVEDGHASRVGGGENAGSVLRNDHVVRRYEPVPAWDAASAHRWRWVPGPSSVPSRVVFVVTDPVTRQPVQAVSLGC